MTFEWLLPLMCRPGLVLRGMHLTRRYRDLFSDAEVESLVDYAIARATRKFVPYRGTFRSFAATFVERAVLRAIATELKWRGRIAELDTSEHIEPTPAPESEVLRGEIQALLGSDYSTYFSHYAWNRSMRDISRAENRSIRSVRKAITRASHRLFERYGYRSPRPRMRRNLFRSH